MPSTGAEGVDPTAADAGFEREPMLDADGNPNDEPDGGLVLIAQLPARCRIGFRTVIFDNPFGTA